VEAALTLRRLGAPVSALEPAELRRSLAGRRFGTRLHVVPETGSTNADLAAAARVGAPDGTVILTEHQTAGRGRAGRTWEGESGRSVLLSALLRPGPPADRGSLVVFAAGLAACDAVRVAAPRAAVALKWPNDVMVGDRKAGGILVEAEVASGVLAHVVIGMGINVHQRPEDLPEGGISLDVAHGEAVDRGRLVVALLVALEDRLAQLESDRGVLVDDYRRTCATLGRLVLVERRSGRLAGTALDVSSTGALLVATELGVEEVTVGDVVHVRAPGGGRI
jgi:BirA family biotin operon repressor/biotin-[acetyl-CoA-carboxylase] ligase